MPEIAAGIEIIDLALHLPKEKTLCIADLHLGYEEMLNAQGVMIPRFNFKDIKERLEKKVLSKLPKLDKIIINGDLKHEFGKISEQEWTEVLDMLEFLQKYCNEIVLIKGNHDTILGPIAKWRNIRILKEFYLPKSRVLFLHGHEINLSKNYNKANTVVIAHEHPAVSVREGAKSEPYKCFLKGKYNGKELIVMPSLNSVAIGTNILKEDLLSPFLEVGVGSFSAWVMEDKPYFFKSLDNLTLR